VRIGVGVAWEFLLVCRKNEIDFSGKLVLEAHIATLPNSLMKSTT
jgi:hypothetical protein